MHNTQDNLTQRTRSTVWGVRLCQRHSRTSPPWRLKYEYLFMVTVENMVGIMTCPFCLSVPDKIAWYQFNIFDPLLATTLVDARWPNHHHILTVRLLKLPALEGPAAEYYMFCLSRPSFPSSHWFPASGGHRHHPLQNEGEGPRGCRLWWWVLWLKQSQSLGRGMGACGGT